jgi:hypothetical protein
MLAGGQTFLRMGLASQLPITSSSSKLYDVFQDPSSQDVTYLRKFVMFNVTNTEDVCNGSIPNLVPVGPFVFRQHKYKPPASIKWPGSNQLQYEYFNDFTFEPTLSIDERTGRQLSDQDSFMLYNGAFFGAAYRLKQIDPNLRPSSPWNGSTVQMLSAGMMNDYVTQCTTIGPNAPNGPASGVFQHHTFAKYIWGYQDPLWLVLQHMINNPAYNVTFYVPSISKFQFNHTQPAPEPISPETGQRCPMWDNQSVCVSSGNAMTSQNTGQDSLDSIGVLTQWAGHKTLPWWDDGCQDFKGATDGTQFKPGLSKSDRPRVFADAMWRPIELAYVQDSSVKGVDTLRFGLAPEAMLSSRKNPENVCYYQDVDGFVNLSTALYAPLLVSKPYYLDADTKGSLPLNLTVNNVTLTPNRDRDDSYLDVEPITGAPMRVSVKVQMNLLVGPQPTYYDDPTGVVPEIYTVTQNLAQTVVPFFTAEDYFEVSDKLVTQFKDDVLLLINFAKYGGIAFTVVGALTLLLGILQLRRVRNQENDGDYKNLNVAYPNGYGTGKA